MSWLWLSLAPLGYAAFVLLVARCRTLGDRNCETCPLYKVACHKNYHSVVIDKTVKPQVIVAPLLLVP